MGLGAAASPPAQNGSSRGARRLVNDAKQTGIRARGTRHECRAEMAMGHEWPSAARENPQARSASEGRAVLATDGVSLAGASGLFFDGSRQSAVCSRGGELSKCRWRRLRDSTRSQALLGTASPGSSASRIAAGQETGSRASQRFVPSGAWDGVKTSCQGWLWVHERMRVEHGRLMCRDS